MVLEDWQHRVIVERDELAAKIDKLDSIFITGVAKRFTRCQRDLMTVQRAAMRGYLQALNDRITDFSEDP